MAAESAIRLYMADSSLFTPCSALILVKFW